MNNPDQVTNNVIDETLNNTDDTTVLNSSDEGYQGPADWPDDWRDKYAGDDEKKKNIISRFASPSAAFDAMIAAQDKLRSGNLKEIKEFPADGTPEEQTAWRQENGIPAEPKAYNLDFGNGLTFGEEDQAVIDDYLQVAHTKNIPEGHVRETIKWYYENLEKQQEAQYEKDTQAKIENIEKLKQEWGAGYKGNINAINSMLDLAPAEVKDMFYGARKEDGSPLFNDADALRFMSNLAREINPATTLVPAGSNQIQAIADELKAIENTMRTDRKTYNNDAAMQQRYRDLLNAKEKMQGKTA